MCVLISNRLFSVGLIFYEFVFYPLFPIPCLYFHGVSVGVCLSCSGSGFLRTGKNLIACETSVPLSNMVEIDNKFQPWTERGGTEGLVGQLPLPYFQREQANLAPKKLNGH